MTQFIDVSTIISPAFFTPVFHITHATPVCSHPNIVDRFWYISKKYCDRAGWDDVDMVDVAQPLVPLDDDVVINIPAVIANLDINDAAIDEENIDSESDDEDDPFGDWFDASDSSDSD